VCGCRASPCITSAKYMSTLDTDFDLCADAVLTLNAGSSSLKFALFCDGNDEPLYNGLVDRIGP